MEAVWGLGGPRDLLEDPFWALVGVSRFFLGFAIPVSPYRGQTWKIRKTTFFGAKRACLGVPLRTISMGFSGHLIISLNKD